MAQFTMDLNKNLIANNAELGIQYEHNVTQIIIVAPAIVSGISIASAVGFIVLEDYPSIQAVRTGAGPYTYTVSLTSEYTQKAGTLSVQLILDIGDPVTQSIRSELSYGTMLRSQGLGDLPSALYPGLIAKVNEIIINFQNGISGSGNLALDTLTLGNFRLSHNTLDDTLEIEYIEGV